MRWHRHGCTLGLLLALALVCASALASGLQVSPVSLRLLASQNADGLWLSNTGSNIIHAQVRVYHWTQSDDGQQLTPSRGLVVSPPMLQLAPGARQLVRVIRVGAPPSGAGAVEDSYRIAIDELPLRAHGKQGLQFVLHYSVPVFLEPAAGAGVAPQLQWSLVPDGAHTLLRVSNSGNGHAQLAQVRYIDHAGRRIDLAKGLLGYVLPQGSMRFLLQPAASVFSDGGYFEAVVNGVKTTEKVPLVDRPQ